MTFDLFGILAIALHVIGFPPADALDVGVAD